MRYLILLLLACYSFAADDTSLGLGPAPVTSAAPSGAAGGGLGGTYPSPTVTLAATDIGYGSGSNTLTGAAGFALVGTPSATAPNTGTNGPGLVGGIQWSGPDGSSGGGGVILSTFGNGTALNASFLGFASQGTAASPGATILNDTVQMALRGHDGTNFTTNAASVALLANSTWSPTNHESLIQFRTVPNASTTSTVAGRVDPNQTLVWGGAFNGSGTFTAGTQRPHIQTSSTNSNNANIAQVLWAASSAGPTGIFAKSRSTTVGTQGVITTGDTLGTVTFQGDDGANFIAAAQVVGKSTGTIGTGQVPGLLQMSTATSAGTMTQGLALDSTQVVLVGNSSAASTGVFSTNVTPGLQVTNKAGALTQWTANATGNVLYFGKSRSATQGTQSLLSASDQLGSIDWQGSDGTNLVSAAQIVVTTTGTPASTRMGGNIVIKTGTDAAPTVMTTAETISNTQTVTWNGTTEASSATVANCVDSGGLAVAKRTFAGTIATTFSGNVLAGVEDGTADTAGAVGEVLTAAQSTPTNFTTTNTIQNLTSISLTRGRWLETATFTFAMAGATEVAAAEASCYLDDTTASATGAVEGETIGYVVEPASASSLHATVTIIFQENISAAKTKYLNAKAFFTAGNPQYTCSMKAVRIR